MALRHILTADGFDAKRAYEINVCELVKPENFDENVIKSEFRLLTSSKRSLKKLYLP
jgi:hypothetical protein